MLGVSQETELEVLGKARTAITGSRAEKKGENSGPRLLPLSAAAKQSGGWQLKAEALHFSTRPAGNRAGWTMESGSAARAFPDPLPGSLQGTSRWHHSPATAFSSG